MLPIVICGSDPTLLSTRKLVLDHAGFNVQTLCGVSNLTEHSGHRLVICSSLSESEQLDAIRITRNEWPEAKILVVGGDELDLEEPTLLRMSAFEGAERFIEHTRRLFA